MPEFDVTVTMEVMVTVEADDADEAAQLTEDGLGNLDHSMFTAVDVLDIDINETSLSNDDD